MALQSNIAEGGEIVTSPSLDYKQKALRHGSLQYQQVFSNQYGSPINLNTSQTPVVFNLPTEVFNLSKSILQYKVNLPTAGANQYIWTPQDALCEIAHIEFYGSNNQFIVNLDQLQNYSKVVIKRETPISVFLASDPMNRLYPSNALANVVPAIRNGENRDNLTATNPSNQNYREPAYWAVGALNTAVNYTVQLPLDTIKNTVMSMDKNLYFGQISYIRVYFGPISKICYSSTSNVNPSAGVLAAYTAAATITELQLMLAVETNPDERSAVINMVNSPGGLQMMIPYTTAFKNPNNGTSQNINIQLDAGQGRTLLKMFHSVWNTDETLDTAYDCANNVQNAGQLGPQKVQQYYTQLNSKRLQNITIDCTADKWYDYLQQKNSLKGSVCENLNVYQWNWHHMDDFSDFSPEYNQSNQTTLLSGVALGGVPITWTFVGSLMNNDQYQHYTYGVFTKKLTITPGQVLVD